MLGGESLTTGGGSNNPGGVGGPGGIHNSFKKAGGAGSIQSQS